MTPHASARLTAILATCVVMATTVATRPLPSESPAPSATSDLRDLVQRFRLDPRSLARRYPLDAAPERFARFQTFYREWEKRIESVAFDTLSLEGRVDHILLRSRLAYDMRLLDREQRQVSDAAALLPF